MLSDCSICSVKYDLDDEIASIECKHTYHKFCLEFWLSKVIENYFLIFKCCLFIPNLFQVKQLSNLLYETKKLKIYWK